MVVVLAVLGLGKTRFALFAVFALVGNLAGVS